MILNCLVAALNKEKQAGEVHFNNIFSLKNISKISPYPCYTVGGNVNWCNHYGE